MSCSRSIVLAMPILTIFAIALVGCHKARPPANPATTTPAVAAAPKPVRFPDLGSGQIIRPGIKLHEVKLTRGSIPMRIWCYQPDKSSGKLPLVLVPPAGSTLAAGMELADGDREEHFPYAKAGFLVVSFDIDGGVPDNSSEAVIKRGAAQFKDARAGLDNVGAAIDFALAKVPNMDPNRIFIAGHSSAATLALLAAEHDSRIKGCIAYAPVTDVPSQLGQRAVGALDAAIPGYRDFLRFSSPDTHMAQLKCPVFLFAALDDKTVPSSESTTFAEKLKKRNPKVTCVTVAKGGHYNSMLREGIPQGIQWLQKLP